MNGMNGYGMPSNMGAYSPAAVYNPYAPNRSVMPPNTAYNAINNGIIWVQGIEGAKAYQIAPNSNVMLMDSENDGRFYIKVSDNVGMCNLRTFSYVETTGQEPFSRGHENDIDMSQYVTKDELQEALKNLKGGKSNGKQFVSANDGKSDG
jgi:hypothetical protein